MSNDVESIQSFCRKYVNKKVKDFFKDISDDDDNKDSISKTTNGRIIARKICLHSDKDPLMLTASRLIIFHLTLGESLDKIPFYGIPIVNFDESVEYKPQVILYFEETLKDAASNNRRPIKAQVGYRIVDGEEITVTDVKNLAKKIKNTFASPKPLKFKKGRTKFSYRDKSKGYQFIISGNAEIEAEKIIKAVLSLNGHTYNEEILTDSESKKNWNSKKKKKKILGKEYEEPERRPIGNVQFTYAELKIHGLPKPEILVDVTGLHPNAYEKTY